MSRIMRHRILMVMIIVAACTLIAATSYAGYETDLKGLWMVTAANWNDITTPAENGTPGSGTTTTTGSHWGASGVFDGTTNSGVDIPGATFASLGDGAMTISTWFYTTGAVTAGMQESLVTNINQTSPTQPGFVLGLTGSGQGTGKLTFAVGSSWTGNIYAAQKMTNATYLDGGWHLATAVYDGSKNANGITLYVDGTINTNVSIPYNSWTTGSSYSSNNLELGDRTNWSGRELKGGMDDIGIWSRALDANEVNSIYRAQIADYEQIVTGAGTSGVTAGTLNLNYSSASDNQLVQVIGGTLGSASINGITWTKLTGYYGGGYGAAWASGIYRYIQFGGGQALQGQVSSTGWQTGTSDWATYNNWSNGTPATGCDASVDNGGTVNITQNGASVNGLWVGSGAGRTGNINMTGGTLSVDALVLGWTGSGATGSFWQAGGTNTVNNLYLGANAGGTGTYSLANGTLTLNSSIVNGAGSGTLNLDAGTLNGTWTSIDVDTINMGCGWYGTGTLNIGNNQTVTAGTEQVGYNSGGIVTQSGGAHNVASLNIGVNSTGTYNLQGGTLSVAAFGTNGAGTSTLNIDGGTLAGAWTTLAIDNLNIGYASGRTGSFTTNKTVSADMMFVGNSGNGTMTETGGATSANQLYVGAFSGSTGNYNLQGGTLTTNHSFMGSNGGSGTFTQTGGTHTPLYLWFGDWNGNGGTAIYDLQGGTLSPTYINANGNGTSSSAIYFNGGTLAGAWTTMNVDLLYVGTGSGLSGTCTIGSGKAVTAGTYESVGWASTGVLSQSAGTNSTPNLYIGYNSGSNGTYNLSGTGSLSVTSYEMIGNVGTGLIAQSNGTNTTPTIFLGYSTGGGTYTQTGGTNTVSSIINFGDWSGNGSSGTYNLQGGTLSVAAFGINGTNTSTINIDGGMLTGAWSTMAVDNFNVGNAAAGSFALNGQAITATNESIGSYQTSASTFNHSSGTNTVTNLTIGNGTYNLTGGTLTMSGTNITNGSGTGTLNIDGGALAGNWYTMEVDNLNIGNAAAGSFSTASSATVKYIATTNESLGNYQGSASTFWQTNGTNTATGLTIGNGTYYLHAGTLTVGSGNIVNGTGTGTLNIDNGSINGSYTAIAVDNFTLGYQDIEQGGNGRFTLDSGKSLSTANETIGYAGWGTLTQNGGTNTVSGTLSMGVYATTQATYSLNGGTLSVNSFGSSKGSGTSTMNIDGGTLSGNWTGLYLDNLNVGNAAAGSFTLTNGQTINATSEALGNFNGTNTFTHTAGTNNATGLTIGYGTYNLNGGTLAIGTGNLTNGTGTGTLNINGGTLNGAYTALAVDTLNVGNTASGALTLTGNLTAPTETIGNYNGTSSLTQSSGTNTATSLTVGYGAYNLNAGTLSVSGAVTINSSGSLVVGNGTTTGTAFSAGSITDNGGLTFNKPDAQTYSGVISGTGTLTKSAAGTLTLNNTGTNYTGATTVNAGTLLLKDTTAFASTATVNSSGILQLDRTSNGFANRSPVSSTITGSGTINVVCDTSGINGGWVMFNNSTAGLNNCNGTINVSSGVLSLGTTYLWTNSTPTLNVASGGLFGIRGNSISIDALTGNGDVMNDYTNTGTLTVGANGGSGTFSGVIHGSNSGAGDGTLEQGILNLTKTGSGTQTLSGTNSYIGTTTVSAGTLALSGGSAIVDAGAVALANTSGAILKLNASEAIGTLSGGGTTGGNVNLQSYTLTVNESSDTSYAGALSGTGGGLTKAGANILTLSGANTYTGTTTINAGTLALSGGSAIADTGAVSLVNTSGTILKLNASEAIGILSGGGTTGGNVNLQSYTLTVNESSDTSYAGALSGTGSLTKAGANKLTLSGANTYTGTTTVNNGILAQSGGTNTSSTVSIGNGTSYNLDGGTLTTANVSGTGTMNLSGGTLSVSGTYSGPTLNMTSGTLKGSGTITNTSFTVDGGSTISPGNSPGTLTFSGGTQTWAGGGSYLWQLYDANGIAGTAFDLINLTNSAKINVTASSSDKFTIAIQGLSGISPDVQGTPLNFSANQNYSWKIVDGASGAINNFDATKFAITTAGLSGVDVNNFKLSYTGDLILSYYGATTAPSGTSTYMVNDVWGGTVNDANKTTSSNYCWAATAANVLDWTGWSTPPPPSFANPNSVFQYYQNHWTNLGGDMEFAWQWFFDGTNPSNGWSGWSQVSTQGGNFWNSKYALSSFYQITDNDVQVMAAIDSYLRAGYGVGLGLYGPGGHAVTAWGFKFDETSGKYLGVYITDSDDSIGQNPPDLLQYYDVVEMDGKWYLQNFYGSNSWYIGEVEGLEVMAKDLIGTAIGSLNLGYSADELMSLIKYYADKKDGLADNPLLIDGSTWYYYSGLLPGDDGSKNIGDSWTIDNNYYIKLGSGLYTGQQPLGDSGTPEPATVIGCGFAFLMIAFRKRLSRQNR